MLVRPESTARWSLLLSLAAGCGEDPAPAAVSASAPAATGTQAALPPRVPPRSASPIDKRPPKPARDEHPAAKKAHYAQRCLVGTLAASYVEPGYTKPLGGDKPGPGKVPDLPAPAAKQRPGGPPPGFVFQRLARVCNIAGSLAEPKHDELDAALKEASGVVPDLGTALNEVASYYARGEHEKDSFAKGRELHDKIHKGLGKAPGLAKSIAKALASFRKANPVPWETEPQKLAEKVTDAALVLLDAMDEKKRDTAEVTKALAALEEAVAALDKKKEEIKGDHFVRMVPEASKKLLERAKALQDDTSPAALLEIASLVAHVLDTRFTAYRRYLSGAIDLPPQDMGGVHSGPNAIPSALPDE